MFRPATLRVLAEVSAAVRHRRGQYFTPKPVRSRLLDLVKLTPGMRVLDPGAGTGEFLLDVLEREPRARVEGYEIDPSLVAIACDEHGLSGVTRCDALTVRPRPMYDLVVGNPPYFEVRAKPRLAARYGDVISGRPNVFAMFFQLGLAALKPGGVLAFVVPPSMNNGAYFARLRGHILGSATIEALHVLDDAALFEGAQQAVQLLVLRKGPTSDRHVFRARLGRDEPTPLFLERPGTLRALLRGRRTLSELGLGVRTGRCVWNQRRADLRVRPTRGTVRLVWAHDIGESFEIAAPALDPARPSYVRERSPDVGPAIVVNRVTGAVGRGTIRAALVPEGMPFVAENHVNVIRAQAGRPTGAGRVPGADSGLLRAVVASLRGDRATSALRALTGNTQLSSIELGHLIPVSSRGSRSAAGKKAGDPLPFPPAGVP